MPATASEPGPPAARSTRATGLAVAVLVIHAGLLIHASRTSFVTADEPGYFAAGVAAWRRGALDLYRVNPPLPRMLSVAPVLAQGVAEDYARWHPDAAGARDEREVGEDFAAAGGPRYLGQIRIARLVTVAWTLLGGWLVFAWARALYGARGGLLALAVWCCEPTVLAHGCLITPDLPATVLGLAAMWAWSAWLARPAWRRALIAGGLLGLALLSKFTNLYLVVLWPALAWWAAPPARGRWRQLAAVAVLAVLVLNLGYGCRGTGTRLGDYAFTSDALTGASVPTGVVDGRVSTGNRFRGGVLGGLPVPLPADLVRGLDVQRRDFEHRFQSYLDGEWRDRGWWRYYLEALALKLPLGLIGLMVGGLALALRAPDRRSAATLCVVGPIAIVLGLVSSQTGFNAHLRYVLPIIPFLAICAGRLAQRRDRPTTIAVAVALVASAGSMLRVYPDTLAYFNELAGGPRRGDDHLIDSNLDWGQDALALRDWIEAHAPDAPLGLAYFGGADPAILGLRYTLSAADEPGLRFASDAQLRAIGPQPGLFAISVNFERGLMFEAPDGAGHWRGVGAGAYTYFRRFRPIATAGYSIRIYCVEPAEANAVRADLALPPLAPGPSRVACDRLRARSASDLARLPPGRAWR